MPDHASFARPRPQHRPCACPVDARPYDRLRDLPRLISLWPSELADQSPAATSHVISKLRRALREERCRGAAGRGSYDLVRHAALLRAFRRECAELLAQTAVGKSPAVAKPPFDARRAGVPACRHPELVDN